MEGIRKARMPWIIVVVIVALVITFSFLFALLIRGAMSKGDFGNYKALVADPGAQVQVAGNGFIYYDGSTFTRVSSAGKTEWTYLIGAGVEFSASAAGVAAWSGETVTLLDMEMKPTYSNSLGEEVTSARLGSKYAAVLLGDENDGRIIVMEPGGRQVYEAEFPQETVIDYGFFSQGSLLWVMALDTTGSVPTCEITTYKPGSKRVVGLISDTEQLMYNVTFQSSDICTAGVTYYKVYDYTGKEIEGKRALVYGWSLMSADDADDPIMAFAPTGQSDGTVELKDVRLMRSDLDQIVRMPFACEALVARGESVFGFSKNGQVMVATAHRQKVGAYEMPFEIDKVFGVTDDGAAVVMSGGTIYIISLGA